MNDNSFKSLWFNYYLGKLHLSKTGLSTEWLYTHYLM